MTDVRVHLDSILQETRKKAAKLSSPSHVRRSPTHDFVHRLTHSLQQAIDWIEQREIRRKRTFVEMTTDIPMEVEDDLCDASDTGAMVNGEEGTVEPSIAKRIKLESLNREKETRTVPGAWSYDEESEDSDDYAIEYKNKENSTQKKEKQTSSRKDKITECDVCGKNFTTAGTLRVHKLTHLSDETAKKPYACDQCDKRFTQAGTLSVHRRQHMTPDDPRLLKFKRVWKCEVCEKEFSQSSSLGTHRYTHLGKNENKRRHVCGHCGKGFTNRTYLNKHERLHTGALPFKCTLCSRSYNAQYDLNMHIEAHSKGFVRKYTGINVSRNHKCILCPKRFRKDFELAAHLKRHADDTVGMSSDEEIEEVEDNFKCQKCGKSFVNRANLERHIYRQHDYFNFPFHCSICDLRYKKKYTFAAHMKAEHDVEIELELANPNRKPERHRPFTCDHCPRSYPTQFALDEHMKTHAGPSSFKCSMCSEEFPTFDLLVAHKKAAHDPLPFECRRCGKKYAKIEELIEHKEQSKAMRMNGYPEGCATRRNDLSSTVSKQVEPKNAIEND